MTSETRLTGHRRPAREMRRSGVGQALVEAALVTPLLLLIILGGAQIGLLILAEMRLTHAVMEGVVAGASEPVVSQRCDTAITATEQVLGHSPTSMQCSGPGNLITLRASEEIALIVPLFTRTWTINAEESAVVRQ